MKYLSKSICILFCSLVSETLAQTYVISSGVSQKITAVNTYDIDYGGDLIKRWEAFAAQAPVLPSQSNLKTAISPSGKTTQENGPLERTDLLTGVVSEKTSSIRYVVSYEAVLHNRKLVPVSRRSNRNNVKELSEEERTLWLKSDDNFYDFEETAFQNWLDTNRLRKSSTETDLNFAPRVFETIKSKYEYGADQNAKLNASAICKTEKAHCGGQSTLFVSTLRANDIPARSLVGKWAQSMKKAETVGNYEFSQQHVKAEFYANNIGWIPVDQSVGVFGSDNGDFIVFHVDYGLDFQTKDFGEQTVPWFWHSVYAVPEGSLGNPKRTEDWQVRSTR